MMRNLFFGLVMILITFSSFSSTDLKFETKKVWSEPGMRGPITDYQVCEILKLRAANKADEDCYEKGYGREHFLGGFETEACNEQFLLLNISYSYTCEYPY